MNAKTLQGIYSQIESRMWKIHQEHDQERREAGLQPGGIMVLTDPTALQYQRLNKILNHVGCHFCAKRDREAGMKRAICHYAQFPKVLA